MVIVGTDVDEVFDTEGVGLCQYALSAVVLVFAVLVLEVYGLARREDNHVNAFAAHGIDSIHLLFAQRCHQLEIGFGKLGDAVGKIVGSTTIKVGGGLGSDNLVEGDMAYAADFLHCSSLF